MKDRAGNELRVGDRVLALVPGTSSSWLEWATVVSFTPKKVRVKFEGDNWLSRGDHLREPRSVVIPANHKGEDDKWMTSWV